MATQLRRFMMVALVAPLLASCGGDKTFSQLHHIAFDPPAPSLFSFDSKKIENACEGRCRAEVQLVEQWQQGKHLDMVAVAKTLVLQQTEAFNSRLVPGKAKVSEAQVETFIGELAKRVNDPSPRAWKVQYEAGLRNLRVNLTSKTLAHIQTQKTLQSFSGTLLFNLVAFAAFGEGVFSERALVVIFEAGHILPGTIEVKHGRNRLFGIETTADGAAVKDFGYVDELADRGLPIRIVDAKTFLLSEVFRPLLVDGRRTMNLALTEAATKYGVPLTRTEKLVEERDVRTSQSIATLAYFNNSIFAFGETVLSDKDRPRFLFQHLDVSYKVASSPTAGTETTARFSAELERLSHYEKDGAQWAWIGSVQIFQLGSPNGMVSFFASPGLNAGEHSLSMALAVDNPPRIACLQNLKPGIYEGTVATLSGRFFSGGYAKLTNRVSGEVVSVYVPALELDETASRLSTVQGEIVILSNDCFTSLRLIKAESKTVDWRRK